MPLAWIIDAMLAATVASLAKVPVKLPRSAQQIVRTLVGIMLGAAITLQLVQWFPDWWKTLLCLLLALAIMFVVGYVALRRIGGFEKPSAILYAIPGGIAEMILLAYEAGADETRVSIMHALRIALTILVMPFLLGWFGLDGERPARPGYWPIGSRACLRRWSLLRCVWAANCI